MEARYIQAQLLKSRESVVEVGRIKFTITRPTEMALVRMRSGTDGQVEINLKSIKEYVTGWEGVLESDLIPNGASDVVPFDRDLFKHWIEDQPKYWEPLIVGIGKSVDAYEKHLGSIQGN
jgi:hypothetical protein